MSLYYGTAYGYDMLEMVSSLCISSSVNFSALILLFQSINQEITHILLENKVIFEHS